MLKSIVEPNLKGALTVTLQIKLLTFQFYSSVDLYQKNKVVCKDRRYFEAKSKGHDATLKRVVKNTLW